MAIPVPVITTAISVVGKFLTQKQSQGKIVGGVSLSAVLVALAGLAGYSVPPEIAGALAALIAAVIGLGQDEPPDA